MPERVRHDEEEAPLPLPTPNLSTDLADRIARLEDRVEEQDDALRRVLTLLVDWIEADDRDVAGTQPVPIRGAATWSDAA